MNFDINPVSLIRSLSMALGLSADGVDMHHYRVALICRGIADKFGAMREQQRRLLASALLHDIGAASSHDERRAVHNAFRETATGETIYTHAEAGYELLYDSIPFCSLADIVRFHHDCYSGGNPSGLSGEEIPLESRIIHIADRVEVMLDRKKPALSQKENICRNIKNRSGTYFDPALVDAFMECAKAESFWLDLENPNYENVFFQQIKTWGQTSFSLAEVMDISELYAAIIDRMSSFTATHSRSVARISTLLAKHCGFSELEQSLMRIAGLLHDLGKLSVPNSILEKNGSLNPDEIRVIRQHTYYTYRLLEQVESFENIAEWAAFHHETLDGTGYPFRRNASNLSLGARIVAVADIFVAITEDRPYRKGMDRDNVLRIMTGMRDRGKIDKPTANMLFDLYAEAEDIVRRADEIQDGKKFSSEAQVCRYPALFL